MDKTSFRFRPFGTRPDVLERYEHDSTFRALVDQLDWIVGQGISTPTELREALILAVTRREMRTVHDQIIVPENIEIEETVFDSIRKRIRGETERQW